MRDRGKNVVTLDGDVIPDSMFTPAGGGFEVARVSLPECAPSLQVCTHRLQGLVGMTMRGMDIAASYALTAPAWGICLDPLMIPSATAEGAAPAAQGGERRPHAVVAESVATSAQIEVEEGGRDQRQRQHGEREQIADELGHEHGAVRDDQIGDEPGRPGERAEHGEEEGDAQPVGARPARRCGGGPARPSALR